MWWIKKQLALSVVAKEFRSSIEEDYADWGIESWSDMLRAFGLDSGDCKEEIRWILNDYSNKHGVDVRLWDDGSFELDNGDFLTYRQFVGLLKKELFADRRCEGSLEDKLQEAAERSGDVANDLEDLSVDRGL